MKIYANQLQTHLKPANTFFILTGHDPFLIKQSTTILKNWATKNQFDERILFTLESSASFDWQALSQTLSSPSMFSPKQVVEWIWQQANLNDKQLDEIISLLPPPQDTLLIVRAGALTKAQMNAKWFKQFSQGAIVVDHWPPRAHELPAFISSLASQKNLKLSREASLFLGSHYEGRLNALDQLLEKLSLGCSGNVSLEQLEQHLDSQYQFDVFALQTALLEANADKVMTILTHLKQAKTELTLVIWCINRLFETLYLAKKDAPKNEHWLKTRGIWPKDQRSFLSLTQKLSLDKLETNLKKIASIDKLHKTGYNPQSWQDICTVALNLIGVYPQVCR